VLSKKAKEEREDKINRNFTIEARVTSKSEMYCKGSEVKPSLRRDREMNGKDPKVKSPFSFLQSYNNRAAIDFQRLKLIDY
jgi:hypothetical protein